MFLLSVAGISGCNRGGDGLQTIGGEPVPTSGRVLLVNYWAEWCKPCREEIPELNHFAREMDGVQVVGVNYDQLPAETVARQARQLGIEFPLLADDPAWRWDRPRPSVLPSTLIIGPDGRWRVTLVGPQTTDTLREAVAVLLGQDADAVE
ncbi:TlpA family protein disulfide reductase [Microbulbifer sp. TYP-18]|uniref:TlpA family protein disulfide reductase n=1 Tax=Microbulbifer sp. TYP-18 TaxID=3230024 RepID=UPI0034C6B9F2